ncbi:MAG: DNA methyltransferase [Candidatus Heimdallarchaeaceae archaeon]
MSSEEEYITASEAAKIYNKSVSNINYLINYKRIKKVIETKEGRLISKKELDAYFESIRKKKEQIIKQVGGINQEIAFLDLSEKDRTKHVHRLHPYFGKFIPQLVEYYLINYFKPGQTVLDPFVGSGTTLVEANVFGANSIGVDISEFNCIIARAKTMKYDLQMVEYELKDILKRVENKFKDKNLTQASITDFLEFEDEKTKDIIIELENKFSANPYLSKWFSKQALKEIFYYKSLIHEYEYKELLMVVLSRAARSSRLTLHFELTRAEMPVTEPYYCHKHRGKICAPVQTSLPKIRRYTIDTIKRIKEYAQIRTNSDVHVIEGDARHIKFEEVLGFKPEIDGIITSPPYLGIIDYHEQHRYAYEIFDLPWKAENEIGPASRGTSMKAKSEYEKGIVEVLKNIKPYLKRKAKLFIVANDKFELYPRIIEKAGYELVSIDKRPVTNRGSRGGNSLYTESIFQLSIND